MPRVRLVSPDLISKEEEGFNRTLRPPTLEEYVGQKKAVEKLEIALKAARQRGDPLEHALFYGPPGLGKTTLAYIIANAMGSKITTTSGPALERTGDLMGILTNLGETDILFIDEIHRLPINIEEFLYPAMEDFKVDFVVDKGMFAKTINVPLKRFTLLGATTRAGSLSAPLRNRFGLNVVAIKSREVATGPEGPEKVEIRVNDLPHADDVIKEGDVLVVIGADAKIAGLQTDFA